MSWFFAAAIFVGGTILGGIAVLALVSIAIKLAIGRGLGL